MSALFEKTIIIKISTITFFLPIEVIRVVACFSFNGARIVIR